MPEKIAHRLVFNKRDLEQIQPPATRRDVYHDKKVRGLQLRVTPSGRKSFSVYRWVDGKPQRITLGLFPDLSVAQARQRAERLNAEIAEGKNPATPHSLTLGAILAEYTEKHLAANTKRPEQSIRSAKYLQSYLSQWKGRRMVKIRRSHVAELHQHIGAKHGRTMANRVLQHLRAAINYAKESELFIGENPAQRIKLFPQKQRTRFLKPSEAPNFFKALKAEKNLDLQHFLWCALLTGARRGDVLSMRWQDVNFESATWMIPDPKNEHPYTVPLADKVLEVLHSRQLFIRSPWVFPGPTGDRPLLDLKRSWARFVKNWMALEENPEKKAAIRNFHVHDLRRSLASWMAANGESLLVIGKSLGHRSVKATEAYSQLDIEAVRQAVGTATQAMLTAGKTRPSGGRS